MWDAAFPYIAALFPTVAVTVLFYFLIKNILEGDRSERIAHAQWEREHAAKETAGKEKDNPQEGPSE